MFRLLLFLFLALCTPIAAEPSTPAEIARKVIAPLLDQAKIATLKGDRPINTRTYKVHYWLEIGHRGGGDVPAMLETAQAATGDKVALDHVLPRAIVPELDARFYNLEILASKVNRAKSAKITEREVAIARRWRKQGLLSDEGLAAVKKAAMP